jgi:hypothetical protein
METCWEIGDAFCKLKLYTDLALPVGSIILIGSLSHLMYDGLAKIHQKGVQ